MKRPSVVIAVVVLIAMSIGFTAGWFVHGPASLRATAPTPEPCYGCPTQIKVPDVVGYSLARAKAVVHRAKLRVVVGLAQPVFSSLGNQVVGQRPKAGVFVGEGTKVTVFVP